MSGKELKKLLLENGWIVVSQNATSHCKMRKGNQIEIVPIHGNKDIHKNLISKILKRTGLK